MPKEKSEDPQISSIDPVEPPEEAIRVRAHQLYEERGCEDGHDLDDWLQAETELAEKKPARRADSTETIHKMAA